VLTSLIWGRTPGRRSPSPGPRRAACGRRTPCAWPTPVRRA